MSTNLIQAIDNTELAQQDIRQAIEDMALDGASVTDIAVAIREHNTAAITNAILGINPCCPSQYSQIVTALNNINTNLAALVAKPCCPQAVWDCDTQTIRWMYPPKYPGGTAPAPEPPEGVIIYDPDYDEPPTFTDEDPRYGEVGSGPNPFPDDGVVLGTSNERCRKANVYVYMMHEELGRYSDMLQMQQAATMIAATIAGGSLAKVGFYFTSKTLGVVEAFVSLKQILAVAGILGNIITWGNPNWLDLANGFEDAINDLVCAIYGASSQRNLKSRWDNAVNKHYDWFSPPAILLKMWMNKTWTANLMDSDIVAKEDAIGYNVDCTCLTHHIGQNVTWWNNLNQVNTAKLVIFTGDRARTNNSHLGAAWTRKTTQSGSDCTCFVCVDSCEYTRYSGRVRLISNTTNTTVYYWWFHPRTGQIFKEALNDNGDWRNLSGEVRMWLVGVISSPFGNISNIPGEFEVEIEGFGI